MLDLYQVGCSARLLYRLGQAHRALARHSSRYQVETPNFIRRWRQLLLPLIVGAGGIALSAMLAHETRVKNNAFIQDRLNGELRFVEDKISARLRQGEQALLGVRGLFYAAGDHPVSKDMFTKYYESLLAQMDAGAGTLGYIERVTRDEEPDFLRRARTEFPSFKIWQINPHSGDRHVIRLIEPGDIYDASLGFDFASEDDRRRVAEDSARSGSAVASAPTPSLLNSIRQHSVFFMMLPIYRGGARPDTESSRLEMIEGWVSVGLTTDQLIPTDFIDQEALHLTITDVTENRAEIKLHESSSGDTSNRKVFTRPRVVDLYGRRWNIELAAHPKFVAGLNLTSPASVFLLGAIFSVSLAISANAIARAAARRKTMENEARYRSIIDASPIPCAINDDAGNISFLNRAFVETFGYRREDIPTLADWWPKAYPDPEYRSWVAAEWAARLDKARALGVPFEPVELRIRTKSGAVRSVMGGAASLDAHFAGEHLVTLQDVTEQKRSEAYVWKLSSRLQLALDVSGAGIWEWDIPNDALTWDATMYRLYGLEPRDSVSAYRSWLAGVHPEDSARAHAATQVALDGTKPYDQEFRVVWPNGEVRWIRAQAAVQRDLSGAPISMIGINRDITEEKNTEDRLRQSERIKALGQLTAGVAHDFNNLLYVISGNLELLADRKGDRPETKRFLDAALRATEQGANLTQRLLSFARKQTLAPAVIDLGAEVKSQSEMLRRAIPEAISLEVITPSEPVPVFADKNQLGNALINLVANARDAMKQGGKLIISVGVETRRETERTADADALPSGSYGVISARDTGCGMSHEVLNRAFDPFFTTKADGKGSGLGLSMVYGFMRQSKGKAELSSEVGKGTTAKLLFPLVESAEHALGNASASHAAAPWVSRHKVLIVDDMPEVLEVVSTQLSEIGFKVATAADGPSALAIIRSSSDLDLLVTDIGLPGGMSGLELAEAATACCPRIKVITMTGYNSPEKSGPGNARKSWVNLKKPVSRSVLTASLNELFDQG